MKTRNIIIAMTLVLAGCQNSSFLDQKPYSQTSPENFYKKESDLELALVGAYETINTHKIPGNSTMQRGSYASGLIYIMNAPSDDICASTSGSGDDGMEMEWGNFIESTRAICDFWKVFYCGINRCNVILHYADAIPMDETRRNQYVAETKFLRAFFYYHLAWNFGGVPIVENYASDGQEPRASLKEVYKFIFEDLEWAYDHISDGAGIISHASINRFGVAAYIGRLANYLAACKRNGTGSDLVAEQPLNDFSWVDADAMTKKAKEMLEYVVTQSSYELIEDYTNLFRETTKTDQERECLFLAGMPKDNPDYFPNSFYLPCPSSAGSSTPTVYGGRHMPTPKAFYAYDPKDTRRDHNFTGRGQDGHIDITVGGVGYEIPAPDRFQVDCYDEDGNKMKDLEGNTIKMDHPLYDSPTMTYMPVSGLQTCPGKFRLAKLGELNHTYQQHCCSIPLMRLADVYLMYAEALYYSGQEAEAREWINKTTKRAAASDEDYEYLVEAYHRDNFIDELLEARQRELIFEFSRKWDLIRFNRIDEAILGLNESEITEKKGIVDDRYLKISDTGAMYFAISMLKKSWQHFKIWLPISEVQRGVNHNLSQNAGWTAAKQ